MNAHKLTLLLVLVAAPAGAAGVASECEQELAGGIAGQVPDGDIDAYNLRQSAKMLNHPALSMLISPLGMPKVKGAVLSVELARIPPLGCKDRAVVFNNALKTEDTNKVPLLPRPRLRVGLPKLFGFDGTLGVAYVPPIPLGNTMLHHAGFELGLSRDLSSELTIGLRYHAAISKVADDIAKSVDEDGPEVLDFYANSLWGLGMHVGYQGGGLPAGLGLYGSFGYANVGTFFLIGDDSRIQNNADPFRGVDYSLGIQMLRGIFDGALEWHQAVSPTSNTMKTVRARLGYRF